MVEHMEIGKLNKGIGRFLSIVVVDEVTIVVVERSNLLIQMTAAVVELDKIDSTRRSTSDIVECFGRLMVSCMLTDCVNVLVGILVSEIEVVFKLLVGGVGFKATSFRDHLFLEQLKELSLAVSKGGGVFSNGNLK